MKRFPQRLLKSGVLSIAAHFAVFELQAVPATGLQDAPGGLHEVASHAAEPEKLSGASTVIYSPDRTHYVAWFDVAQFDADQHRRASMRWVVCGPAHDGEEIFSYSVGSEQTHAAWNSNSTRCIITIQPDNGSVLAWLIYKTEQDKWLCRKFEPLTPVEAAYERAVDDNRVTDVPPLSGQDRVAVRHTGAFPRLVQSQRSETGLLRQILGHHGHRSARSGPDDDQNPK